MKYCLECKTGKLLQFAKFCHTCGGKLVDVPVEDCDCGYKPKAHNAFCGKCGKELKVKQHGAVKSLV